MSDMGSLVEKVHRWKTASPNIGPYSYIDVVRASDFDAAIAALVAERDKPKVTNATGVFVPIEEYNNLWGQLDEQGRLHSIIREANAQRDGFIAEISRLDRDWQRALNERDSYQRQSEGMRAKCEAMQHIVNCASAFASTDEDGGSDDEDYIEQLFEAVRDYRAALQSDSKDGA